MKRLLSVALAIAAMALSMMAGDLKVTFNTESKVMLGTKKGTDTHYYSSRYHLIKDEKEKTDFLIDFKEFITYDINHKKKTIKKITMDDLIKMMELSKAHMEEKENKAAMATALQMLGGDADATVSVKRGGAEVVAGRKCDKWNVAIGNSIVNNFSVDPTLEPPITKVAYEKGRQLQNAAMMMVPNLGEAFEKYADELIKIKGIRLKEEMQTKMGPVTTRVFREAVKIEEGPIPASMFELPNGYKQEEPIKKMLEDQRKKK